MNDQKASNDVFHVGTIESAVDGHMPKKDSTGTDLALLAKCDHMIISHGTYGMWAAFLSSSENTHIMAHKLSKKENSKEDSKEVIEELRAIKEANLSNFIFMDDQ